MVMIFFFFKQKTAYEMRISDWSSDVCSSDLFYDWIIKWTARYLCEEHYRGIAKFAQALRVKVDADKRIKGKARRKLTEYLRENHPGHRNDYEEPEGDEDRKSVV